MYIIAYLIQKKTINETFFTCYSSIINGVTKSLFFLFTLFTIVQLSSCQTDEWQETNVQNNKNNGFSLSYHLNGSISALTKSHVPLEEGEDQINSFYILFFENTTGGTGVFLDAIKVKEEGEPSLSSSGTIDVLFPANSQLTNTEDYKLILCANIEKYTGFTDFTDLKDHCEGLTEEEVIKTLFKIAGVNPNGLTHEQEQTDNSNQIAMSNLPMSASLIKKSGETTLSVELSRAVSRFDVSAPVSGYELVSASIWNAISSTTMCESPFNNFSAARTERYYGVFTEGKEEIIGSLYAFENYVSSPEQNDKKSTCLIIGLQKPGKAVEYFRVNVNVSSRGQQIKRNTVYSVSIMHITRPGYATEREAYESPEISIDYLIASPTEFEQIPAGGGSTEKITVFSSGKWTAKVTINNGSAYFEEAPEEDENEDDADEGDTNTGDGGGSTNEPTTWKGNSGDSFIITLGTLTNLYSPAEAIVTITLDGKTSIKDEFSIFQKELSPDNLVIQTRRKDRAGSLFNLKKAVTHTYVYGLATQMRDETLFGQGGKLVNMKDGIIFAAPGTSKKHLMEEAHIYQITGIPSSNRFKELKAWMEADTKRLLFFTNHDGYARTSMETYKSTFKITDYEVSRAAISSNAKLDRRFIQNPDIDNKLIAYLLKNGPATAGQAINPEKIVFKGRGSVDRALIKWPETFIPIIMAAGNSEYCIFGIDPTNRIIWLSDPGIFGSKPTSSYQNKANFDESNTENIAFMNNFIAWMINAALQGEDFTGQFK